MWIDGWIMVQKKSIISSMAMHISTVYKLKPLEGLFEDIKSSWNKFALNSNEQ